MSIEILPARLANQIAAGEVVERPASVVKELIENSLDAGATKLHIDIEKGGRKRIRIIDNGDGIVKHELCLALSRHATSKIKNLDDLESITSLGFRGEALASISSVSRLSLTSKPKAQAEAWQACAQGRDMEVTVQPAAHPDGTTIDVQDLFFNTPARRKFLRTDKTEFTHVDEVIRRIALARFDVAISLTHNGKMIRQYQALSNKTQYGKRVAKICGQKFIDHALTIDCQHEDLHLWGWVATPDFVRNQNDLSYSYVNGRMMRDKLINHAIRQAFADSLPSEGYPAFVLYLELDHREVDVNVHPAKHEVRFHQGRYVHDFIYSVIHGAIIELSNTSQLIPSTHDVENQNFNKNEIVSENSRQGIQFSDQTAEYITPLRKVNEVTPVHYDYVNQKDSVTKSATQAYQGLMTSSTLDENHSPANPSLVSLHSENQSEVTLFYIEQEKYALCFLENQLRLLDIYALAVEDEQHSIAQRWSQGLVSQPLLLPQQLKLAEGEITWLAKQQVLFEQAGIILLIKDKTHVQIRQFPACLRQQDVCSAFIIMVKNLMLINEHKPLLAEHWLQVIAQLTASEMFTLTSAQLLLEKVSITKGTEFKKHLCLNSVKVDLTSSLSKFTQPNKL